MLRFRISDEATMDLVAILSWAQKNFGEQARLNYEELIIQSILDISDNPSRVGTSVRSELTTGAMTYHIRYSRDSVKIRERSVRKPRHFLIYRITPDHCVEIGRILHDSVDFRRHLPDDYRTKDEVNPSDE